MLKEFREFAMRGNVVDVAVGIIIGAAFGAIVNSFVSDVLTPIIGMAAGGVDFSNSFVLLKEGTLPGPYPSLAATKTAGGRGRRLRDADQHDPELPDRRVCVVPGHQSDELDEEAGRGRRAAGALKEEVLLTQIRDLLARR